MLIEEIDTVGSQAFESSFDVVSNVVGTAVQALRGYAASEAKFCSDDDMIAEGFEGFADDLDRKSVV